MAVKEFMDCYNAAIAGKKIVKRIIHHGYIEDYYEYEDVNFLNVSLDELVKSKDNDDTIEFYIEET